MSSETANLSYPHIKPTGSTTVAPQHVTDPTILDSVAGFINDVVPASYTYNGPFDSKDQIQWARFEDINPSEFYSDYDYDETAPAPIILILGYTSGIQVWAIPASGEATEILSWRHGSIRVLKILPSPSLVSHASNTDAFKTRRPLLALSDSSTPGVHYNSVNFLSLKTGEQVKVIKFKNPVLGVLANKYTVIITFQEKIAVFDALTLEDQVTVTTCYLSPGLQPNPVTLGKRWLAYAEKKLNPLKRSSGGNDGDGVHSYTATVIQAAKSLGRGLRELSESVASSLTGNSNKPGTSPNSPQAGGQTDITQKGIVTILDLMHPAIRNNEKVIKTDAIVAHFTAHTEAIVCLQFDPSGMLLLTADKRGHDFHLFRIQPHPCGSSLAAVHHLYILHRGDTSARVQDVCFSPDSRWATVSTIRGTTHVFPITPYGGNVGVRTHATPHIVNKMSRFHRSAGLTVEGRSSSPVTTLETTVGLHCPYYNSRFPPFPHPTVVQPLAQIRQPVNLQNIGNVSLRTQSGRQRLPSLSEDNVILRVAACFAPPRAWIDISPREAPLNKQPKPMESLFIISCYGMLVQYDLEPLQSSNIPKEKVCSETPIELLVTAKAQWLVQRQLNSCEIPLPMTQNNLNLFNQEISPWRKKRPNCNDDQWLSQVEIVTHAGPHRRLWMGPQFTFKTYTTAGSPLSVMEAQPLDLEHSKPVNMPITKANAVLIECSSANSCEQSLLDAYQKTFETVGGAGELQLKEDLADAMLESPGVRESGGRCVIVQMKPTVAKVVNPLGTVVNVQSSDDETNMEICEDIPIHENCDEALFRPMLVSKVTPSQGLVNRYGDNIITKSLESTTEVAVKILKNRSNCKPQRDTYGSEGSRNANEGIRTTESTDVKRQFKSKSKTKIDVLSSSVNTCNFKPVIKSKETRCGEEETSINSSIEYFKSEPDNIGELISLESKEGGQDDNVISNRKNCKMSKHSNKELQCFDDPSNIPEVPMEDKTVYKKAKKPKAKLGVKIPNSTKIDDKPDKEYSPDLSITEKPSNVSLKPSSPPLLIDIEQKEYKLDLSDTEYVEEFTIHLPKPRSDITNLGDSPTLQEEKRVTKADSIEVISENISTLKIGKLSDEEMGSSSPIEVTESDDSGKNITIGTVFNEIVDNAVIPPSKSSRRKKRKK